MKNKFQLLLIIILCTPLICAAGYVGDLPSLDKSYEHKPDKNLLDDIDAEDILPLEKNDLSKNKLHAIINDTQYSSYLNDLDKIIVLIEQLKNILKEEKSLQHYRATAQIIDLNVKEFKEKYGKDNEAYFESYKALTNLSENINLFGDYWVYQNHNIKHVSSYKTSGFYSNEYVHEKIENLLFVIEDTLGILKDSDG